MSNQKNGLHFGFVVKTSFEERRHRFDQRGVVVTNRGYSDWAEIPADVNQPDAQ